MSKGFSDDFLWGGAIAAAQADGGFRDGGKGISTQDLRYFDTAWSKEKRTEMRNVNMTTEIFNNALNDVDNTHYPFRWGIDFYHTYKDDLRLMKELGLKIFRTSICWSRIYPNGDDAQPNEEGIQHYVDLFSECKKLGIKVFATILHYDIPVNLVLKYDGWKNRKVVYFYEKYVRTLFERLGDLVDFWLPFNEINCSKFNPYNGCCLIKDQEEDYESAIFQCAHHQFIANALAVKAAKEMLKNPMVGGMIARFTTYPATCKPEDMMQTILDENYKNYFYTDVMARGKYPSYTDRMFAQNNIHIVKEDEEKYFEQLGAYDSELENLVVSYRDKEDHSTAEYNKKIPEIISSYGLNKDLIEQALIKVSMGDTRGKDCFWFIQAPVKFEFLLTLYAYMYFGNDFIYKPNFICDEAGIPYSHAPGNIGDIEIYNRDMYWLIEATLIRSKMQQVNNETVNLFRHVDTTKVGNKYLTLVAPYIHDDTKLIFNVASIITMLETEALVLYSDAQTTNEFVAELRNDHYFEEMQSKSKAFISNLRAKLNSMDIG